MDGQALRIAMLAPPWIPVPPEGYGGIELVVALLTDQLVERGHRVTLFAAPGSESAADVEEVLELPHPDEINFSLFEADHVGRAFDEIERAAAEGEPFDVIHDHCFSTTLAMADRAPAPVVHTVHGPFTADTTHFYERHGPKACVVCISRHQLSTGPGELPHARVVPNPIDVEEFPFCEHKDEYVLWIGRMAPVKGAARAIDAARRARVPIVLAGPVQAADGQEAYFRDEIEPHLDGERVRYVGEVGGAGKAQLIARARALLMPIRWAEPFGMVMVEAMACGTPVIAFREGSAPEIVLHGETGFLVDDEEEMSEAIGRLGEIDPRRCRRHVNERFDVRVVASAYEQAYRDAAR